MSALKEFAALREHVAAGKEEGVTPLLLEAIARRLEGVVGASSADGTLKDGLSRQLAWGATQKAALEQALGTCTEILDLLDERGGGAELRLVVAEVSSAAARFVSMAAVARAQADRAARMREELAQMRLEKALEGQRRELRLLTK